MYKTRLYTIWRAMKSRCYTKINENYCYYGGRGIKVCEKWRNNFMEFHNWALENGYDENAGRGECTLDRIDVNGDYEPQNCRWVNSTLQARNKRNNGNNSSGYTGISFNKRIKFWEVHIGVNGKKIHVGNFKELEKAIIAREEAIKKYW